MESSLTPSQSINDTLSSSLGAALQQRCIPFMTKFYADTLARLLLSFMPLYDFLERHSIQPHRIGSFGSGSCAHETFLAKLFLDAQIECFDASEKYIPEYVGREMAATGRIAFHETNFDTFDWGPLSRRYDFVFSIQTLEHIEDAWTALQNIAGTVANNGLLYIDTPFYSGLDENEDKAHLQELQKRQWEKNQHFHIGFSHTEMARRLSGLGFAVVDRGYLSYHGGDARFLHFFRNSELFKGRRADVDTALSLALTLLTLLRRNEETHAAQFAEIDRCNYKARPADAMRILLRRS